MQRGPGSHKLPPYLEKLKRVSDSFPNVFLRMSDLFSRLDQIEWTRIALNDSPEDEQWRIFAGLMIKDWHIDLSGVMDSVAPVVIHVENRIEGHRIPGFADIQDPRAKYKIPLDIQSTIQQAHWWETVKEVRNLVTHREHNRIIFAHPSDGVFFKSTRVGTIR
jgi:hypothetical protein